jgi:Phosphoglucomutase/phosphomannomutase, alpha/beta/alpha domain I
MPSTLKTQPKAGIPHEVISPIAGKPAPKEMLVDVARLEKEYFERRPDLNDPNQMVSFGTSGHRGSPFHGTFTEAHILAITQAICDYRRQQRTDGPLYMGKDTHGISTPAQRTALEVLAGNNVETIIQQADGVRHGCNSWRRTDNGCRSSGRSRAALLETNISHGNKELKK